MDEPLLYQIKQATSTKINFLYLSKKSPVILEGFLNDAK